MRRITREDASVVGRGREREVWRGANEANGNNPGILLLRCMLCIYISKSPSKLFQFSSYWDPLMIKI